jgi:hypothetical protein
MLTPLQPPIFLQALLLLQAHSCVGCCAAVVGHVYTRHCHVAPRSSIKEAPAVQHLQASTVIKKKGGKQIQHLSSRQN